MTEILLPPGNTNSPLFIRPDDENIIAYLKPMDFEGQFPLTNWAATFD